MAQILVRGLDPEVVERLRRTARSEGRSLEAQVREILTNSARLSADEARALALELRARTAKGKSSPAFRDSTELIRADRDR